MKCVDRPFASWVTPVMLLLSIFGGNTTISTTNALRAAPDVTMKKTITLDHLVYVVPDLHAAIDDLEKKTGVRPVIGGKHVALGKLPTR